MACSDPLDPICLAIGLSCRTADTVESKILHKDFISCEFG
jgi:hypothetical protein